MTTIFIPDIPEKDYGAFLTILHGHLPETYDNWLKLASKLRDDVVARGQDAVSVEVNADEFSQYLKTTTSSPNAKGLSSFVREKAIALI